MAKSFIINKNIAANILIVLGLIGALYNMFNIHQEAEQNILEKYEKIKPQNDFIGVDNIKNELPFNKSQELIINVPSYNHSTEPLIIYPDNEYLVAFKLINVIFYLFFVSLVYGRLDKIIKK